MNQSISKHTVLMAHLALLGANLLYGAGFSVAKFLMPSHIQPQGFILIRVSVACVLFWLSYFLGNTYKQVIEKKHWPRLVLCGITGVACNQLLFFAGLSKTSPIHASLIMLCTPILVSIIAGFLLKEKLTGSKMIGLLLAVAGALVLVLSRSGHGDVASSTLGDLFILLNAASYAIYLVAVKPLMLAYRPIVVIRWVFLIGFFIVLPFGAHQLVQVQWAAFGTAHWYALLFIVLGVTFFTYLWNIFALRTLSASTAGAYIYLQPLFAAIISMFFLHESFTIFKAIAGLLIFIGVALVTGFFAKSEKQDK